ncbi:Lsr2 family protein [Acidothermaceae bacterium B102]|nr:Lsr2 family protein [Acidothermaceae bacterium B102]
MAQRVQVLLVCDVHDDDTTPGTETISFSLDGTSYEIDVCDDHAEELRDAVAPYVGAGRRIGGARSGRRSSAPARAAARPAATSDRQRAGDIRAWAKSQGLNVNERGRIPATIVAQYEAAH